MIQIQPVLHKSLAKYFRIYRKNKLLTSVREGLASLENDVYIDRKDQDLNRAKCRKVAKKSYSQFRLPNYFSSPEPRESIASPLPVYFMGRRGEITEENDQDDPSQLILIARANALFIGRTSITNQLNMIQFLRELQSFSDIFEFITDKAKQIRESLQKGIRAYSKRLNHFFLAISAFLSRKYKSKHGIGRGVEGYIPFTTWARGSLISQLVNHFIFVDKLSQPNNVMEMSYGC